MCDYCKSNELMRVLDIREPGARVRDSKGFVLAMDMTNEAEPKLKSFFWGVGDDPDFGRALTIGISYCPFCGRKIVEEQNGDI